VIRGFFDAEARRPTPRVRAVLLLPDVGARFGSIDFQIDTGADESVLHPADALRLGLRIDDLVRAYTNWGEPSELAGIAGRTLSYHVTARYVFQPDRRPHPQQVSSRIHIAKWMPENDVLPSLLGWDVLQHFRFSMDWASCSIARYDQADPELK
jgi:hypothetical protein